MRYFNYSTIKWWGGFFVSVSLPAWFIGLVLNFGGWVVEDLDYGLFKLFTFLCFPLAFASMIYFLRKPDRYFGLRFATGWVLGLVLTLGSCTTMVGSSCGPETIRLGKMWAKDDPKYAFTGECSSVALAE